MSTKAQLIKRIDAYLKTKKKSDGGWAPVDPPEVGALMDIVSRLIALKYERDPDGDLPIQYDITDRTRYERSLNIAVPYSHKATDGKSEIDLHLDASTKYGNMAKWATDSATRHAEMARMLLQETTAKHRALDLNGVHYRADTKGVTRAMVQAVMDKEVAKAFKSSPPSATVDRAARYAWAEAIAETGSQRLGIKVLGSSCQPTLNGVRVYFEVPGLEESIKVEIVEAPATPSPALPAK